MINIFENNKYEKMGRNFINKYCIQFIIYILNFILINLYKSKQQLFFQIIKIFNLIFIFMILILLILLETIISKIIKIP